MAAGQDECSSVANEVNVDVVSSFFFSSRRRHTRLQGDWSSDVCSSDLVRTDAHHVVVAIDDHPQILRSGVARGVGDDLLRAAEDGPGALGIGHAHVVADLDRKSTRLNSSHLVISYAVFCLKKKKKKR